MAARRVLKLAVVAAAAFAATLTGPEAGAQAEPDREHINVLGVNGLVDSVVVDSVSDAVARAERDGAIALVLQVDSTGAVVSRRALDALIERLGSTEVAVGVWVGPAGASADHASADLLAPADLRGRAPGTSIAKPGAGRIIDAPTLGDFIVSLDGVETRAGRLSTAEVEVNEEGQPRRRPTVEVRFVEAPLIARLLHIVASPAVSYLLLLAAIGLALLELFSLGGGLAAGTAAVCFLLSAYGLAELPTRPLGLALVALAGLGFAVDIQAGTARFWTAVGAVGLLAGTMTLFGPGLEGPVGLPWAAGVTGVLGLLLLVVRAMPSIVRSRTTAGGLNPTLREA